MCINCIFQIVFFLYIYFQNHPKTSEVFTFNLILGKYISKLARPAAFCRVLSVSLPWSCLTLPHVVCSHSSCPEY